MRRWTAQRKKFGDECLNNLRLMEQFVKFGSFAVKMRADHFELLANLGFT